jgi:hypothetical protein
MNLSVSVELSLILASQIFSRLEHQAPNSSKVQLKILKGTSRDHRLRPTPGSLKIPALSLSPDEINNKYRLFHEQKSLFFNKSLSN